MEKQVRKNVIRKNSNDHIRGRSTLKSRKSVGHFEKN